MASLKLSSFCQIKKLKKGLARSFCQNILPELYFNKAVIEIFCFKLQIIFLYSKGVGKTENEKFSQQYWIKMQWKWTRKPLWYIFQPPSSQKFPKTKPLSLQIQLQCVCVYGLYLELRCKDWGRPRPGTSWTAAWRRWRPWPLAWRDAEFPSRERRRRCRRRRSASTSGTSSRRRDGASRTTVWRPDHRFLDKCLNENWLLSFF